MKNPFHVLAKPIGAICNLGCKYCYYLSKQNLFEDRTKMSENLLEIYIKNYIESMPDEVEIINFAWQGGEPTLIGIEFYEKAIYFQKKYAPSGKQIVNCLQTNGTLLNDAWCDFLKNNQFLIGISIDGPKAIHDRYRTTQNQKPSFDMVLQGLMMLKKYSIPFNTLTTVHKKNQKQGKQIYEYLKKLGSTYMQFIPIVVLDSKLQQDISCSVSRDGFGTFLKDVFEAWSQNKDYGKIWIQQFEAIVGVLNGNTPLVCVHAQNCGNCLAVEHNGNVYSCDHFVTENNYLGNCQEQPFQLLLQSQKQKSFGENKYYQMHKSCLNCDVLKFCYGGCPKDRFQHAAGNVLVNQNYLCPSYYRFFSYAIPRLLKLP